MTESPRSKHLFGEATSMSHSQFLPTREAILALDAAVRHKSFSLAAAELGVTQGAITRHIQKLEQNLGTNLFVKSGRNIRPTKVAIRYNNLTMVGIRQLIAATDYLNSAGVSPPLRLAVLPTVSSRWLVPSLSHFLEENDHVSVTLSIETNPFNFSLSNYDAAIHSGFDDWPGCKLDLLFPETVLAVCSPELADNHAFKSVGDLDRVQLLVTPVVGTGWLDRLGEIQLGKRGAGRSEFETFASVIRAARLGMGIAIVPAFLVQRELENGQLVCAVDGLFQTGRGLFLAYPEETTLLPNFEAFRKFVVESARQLKSELEAKYEIKQN